MYMLPGSRVGLDIVISCTDGIANKVYLWVVMVVVVEWGGWCQ
jgi:hypothetical protein